MTDRRLLFQPNRFDAAIGGKRWEQAIGNIVDVEGIDREPTVLAGGSRKRLGIKTTSGVEVFVVNGLAAKMSELRSRLLSGTL